MAIDVGSPLFAVLADWVKILLTLPDPPPEQLRQLNEVAVLTAISTLSERLSGEAGSEIRNVLQPLLRKVAGAQGTKA